MKITKINILIILSILGFISCNAKYDQKEIIQKYDISMNIIINPKDEKIMFSSNSKDYINASKDEYKKLLSIGKPLINYILDKFKNTNSNGLEEAIMAQLCIDYLGDEASEIEWLSGREWFEKYKASK